MENWQTPSAYGHSPYLRGRVICPHKNSSPKLGEVLRSSGGVCRSLDVRRWTLDKKKNYVFTHL